jgi:hypothetical protein
MVMKHKKPRKLLKGQFFLLGAILIVGLIFWVLPKPDVLVESHTEDITYLFKNIQNELPRALNLGINESRPIDHLKNFTLYIDSKMSEHLINFTCLWIVTEGDSALSELNITVGNFLGYTTTIILNLSGAVKNLVVFPDSTNSTIFSSVQSEFNLTIKFNGEEENVRWQRDKINLYAMIELKRGENLIKKGFSR